MKHIKPPFTFSQHIAAWAVHLFTASAAFIGILTLFQLYRHEYVNALWLMALALVIDSIDGSLARVSHVKTILPKFDGALLDNIVDYLNYVVTPCFFLLIKPGMLPEGLISLIIIAAVSVTSTYQFCQSDAKTPDHFFKGFPCYWNLTLFYMLVFNTSQLFNATILILFCILIFVPIKYVYPSRLDYLTDSRPLKILMHVCSIIFGISTFFLLLSYPETNPLWLGLSIGYVVLYFLLSFYRTYAPLSSS